MQSEEKTHLVWVLADDRAGNVSQAIGVAEALAQPFKRIDISYNRLAKLPNFIRRTSLIGVTKTSREKLQAPWPDLVIAAGRRTAPIARWIKHQSEGKTRICQIMRPDCALNDFDLIAVPAHDRMRLSSNMLELPGAPHRITETRLILEASAWKKRFASFPQPRIALLIGGSTKKTSFEKDMAQELLDGAIAVAKKEQGSLLITTSRRTGRDNEKLIKDLLSSSDVPYHLHDWNSKDENPYGGLLALADIVIVTGDSVSMCCEAAASHAGVYIYRPKGLVPPRHQRLHETLFEQGYARPFDAGTKIEKFSHPSLQPSLVVAQRCLELLNKSDNQARSTA